MLKPQTRKPPTLLLICIWQIGFWYLQTIFAGFPLFAIYLPDYGNKNSICIIIIPVFQDFLRFDWGFFQMCCVLAVYISLNNPVLPIMDLLWSPCKIYHSNWLAINLLEIIFFHKHEINSNSVQTQDTMAAKQLSSILAIPSWQVWIHYLDHSFHSPSRKHSLCVCDT